MGTQRHLWWQKTKQHLVRSAAIVITVMLVTALIVVIVLGCRLNWDWLGLNQKTLWDWLQLLIAPAVISLVGLWFTRIQQQRDQRLADQRAESERKATEQRAQTEHEVATDNQREAALQMYIDRMSELVLHENLCESQPEDEVRKVARVRTLTVLTRLDGARKRSVLQFLYEARLIEGGYPHRRQLKHLNN